ncbi:hypothetical protein ACFQ60_03075 [Streptomyces zhihengii]
MGRVAAALSTLDHWHTMTWTDVAEAAGDAVHFLWEAWKGSAAFHALPRMTRPRSTTPWPWDDA